MRQEKFSDSVKIISLNRKAVLEGLRIAARRLCAAHPKVKDVRVFGSVAQGTQTGTSDADVLIVLMNGGGQGPLERTRTFYRYFDLSIGVDLLTCTENELAHHLQTNNPFWEQVWRESFSLLAE